MANRSNKNRYLQLQFKNKNTDQGLIVKPIERDNMHYRSSQAWHIVQYKYWSI